MDRFAAWVTGVIDDDLILLPDQGMAYQRDQSLRVEYDQAYFDKCAGYEGQEIAERINAARINLVLRHFGEGPVVDVGIGSGEFIRKRPKTYGYDINPIAQHWLSTQRLWATEWDQFKAFTFWDVIEHCPDPDEYFRKMKPESYLFTSIPIFYDLREIRKSKHYRPGEHLMYFLHEGFIKWMGLHKFTLLEWNDEETKAGRESIHSYAFKKHA